MKLPKLPKFFETSLKSGDWFIVSLICGAIVILQVSGFGNKRTEQAFFEAWKLWKAADIAPDVPAEHGYLCRLTDGAAILKKNGGEEFAYGAGVFTHELVDCSKETNPFVLTVEGYLDTQDEVMLYAGRNGKRYAVSMNFAHFVESNGPQIAVK